MKTFKEFLNEAKISIEGEDRYKNSHGKKPGGKGTWIFAINRNVNFETDKEGVDYYGTKGNTSYADAKKEAREWAKQYGYDIIYLQS